MQRLSPIPFTYELHDKPMRVGVVGCSPMLTFGGPIRIVAGLDVGLLVKNSTGTVMYGKNANTPEYGWGGGEGVTG